MEEGHAAPDRSGGAAGTTFVGRSRDLTELRTALDEAVNGHGSLVLVAGEPGIGKTRLAERLALEAAPLGAVMLWGRGWEGGGAPPFWPWIQVIRQVIRHTIRQVVRAGHREAGHREAGHRELEGDALVAAFGADGPDAGIASVVRMMPELAGQFPEPAELTKLPPAQARFQLFDGVATLLARASESRPLLLVLDDLHWADVPSLLLLKFVARELRGMQLLMLGTYRDVNGSQTHTLDELAGELGGSCHRMVLRGLAPDEVTRLITLTTGTSPAPQLAASVRERTGGNPLFVREVARLLAAGVPGAAVPEGVRPVLGRRLDLLSPACAKLLAAAAVVGRDLRLDLVEALTDQSAAEVLDLLDEAVTARLVEQVAGVPSRWRFVHALVREVLYERLSPARRVALHRRAGEAIEGRFSGDLEPHLAELADHFLRAGPAAGAKAVDYATRAGRRATELLAFEEATGHLQRALDALDLAPEVAAADPPRRCELELALAEAHMAVGEVPAARAGFERAAALARRHGSPERLAHAALGLGAEDIVFTVDELQIRLLEEARTSLDDDSALHARVSARLARALLYTWEADRRITLCDQAAATARRIGDPATLAAVLCDRHTATLGLEGVARHLVTTTTEVVQLAEAAGDRILALHGRSLRCVDLLQIGDGAALRAETDAYERGARALRQPHLLWQALALRANLAILDGRFDEAEQLVEESLAVGRRASDPAAITTHVAFHCVIGMVKGTFGELESRLREIVRRAPVFVFHLTVTLAVAQAGRTAEARAEFDRLAADRFASLPRDSTYLICLGLAALIASGLGDTERAAILYGLLQPYDGQVIRASRVGGGCAWPVSHHLGLLAATMGRWDDAVAHLAAAMRLEDRLGALPYLATTRYYHALALRGRDQSGDEEHTAQELDKALSLCRRFGIRPLFASGTTTTATGAPDQDAEPPAAHSVAVLRREGEYWTVGWQGNAFRLRDTVGLAYLARLIATPGRELHALDLASPGPTGGSGGRGPDEANLGPLLDEQAKRAYRQRLRDLDEELAEADSWHDQDRAARAHAERDTLAHQLAAALGLGGRDRNPASSAERARVSVTKALRTTVRRIAEHDPALGEHLQRGLHTGTFCAYHPDPDHQVTWQLAQRAGQSEKT